MNRQYKLFFSWQSEDKRSRKTLDVDMQNFVNHQLKGEGDNPTIGLLVCKYKDSVEAQYALESSTQPIGVSAYQLSKLLPEQFKSSLPSIEELENVLEEYGKLT